MPDFQQIPELPALLISKKPSLRIGIGYVIQLPTYNWLAGKLHHGTGLPTMLLQINNGMEWDENKMGEVDVYNHM